MRIESSGLSVPQTKAERRRLPIAEVARNMGTYDKPLTPGRVYRVVTFGRTRKKFNVARELTFVGKTADRTQYVFEDAVGEMQPVFSWMLASAVPLRTALRYPKQIEEMQKRHLDWARRP